LMRSPKGQTNIFALAVMLFLVLNASIIAPLTTRPDTSQRFIEIEKLVVIGEDASIKNVTRLNTWIMSGGGCCTSRGANNFTVVGYRYEVLFNYTSISRSYFESAAVIRLNEFLKPSTGSSCTYALMLDAVLYSRGDEFANVSVLILNFRTPRSENYTASIMYVKVYPKLRPPTPKGEAVVVERTPSLLGAINAVKMYVHTYDQSTMKSLGLHQPIEIALHKLAETLLSVDNVSSILGWGTKFLVAILADPASPKYPDSVTYIAFADYIPLSSGDVRDDGGGGGSGSDECQTDADCWAKYGSYCYTCSSVCVDINWWNVAGCIFAIGSCLGCALSCSTVNLGCIICIIFSCGGLIFSTCPGWCNKWEKRCVYNCPDTYPI